MKKIGEIGELALLEEITSLLGGEGFLGGDDCAVIESRDEKSFQLLKTDAVVEGVHFLKDESAERVGWKAMGRVVSDFAAMGGWGKDYLVTIALDEEVEVDWVKGLYTGMQKCLNRCVGGTEGMRCGRIVGGETVSVPRGTAALVSVAGTGEVEKRSVKRRRAGEVGDVVFVTGVLGGSLGGKHLDFLPRFEEGIWLGKRAEVGGMMDLSDGLAKDLPRLAKASSCGFQLDRERVPCSEGCTVGDALSDGEDYELLFTVRGGKAESFSLAWEARFPELKLSAIGRFVSKDKGESLEGGWEHFS